MSFMRFDLMKASRVKSDGLVMDVVPRSFKPLKPLKPLKRLPLEGCFGSTPRGFSGG